MARLAKEDTLEKFRFRVTFLRNVIKLNDTTAIEGNPKPGNSNFARAGFSEISLPRANITEVLYRDNLSPPSFQKQAGLTRYEPVTLRRGATSDSELYTWLKLTNNDIGYLNVFSGAVKGFAIPPFQISEYRTDIVISVLNRDGSFSKHWILFNCFPVSYKAGDDLVALSDTKLIEELAFAFEVMFETKAGTIEEAIMNVHEESSKAVKNAAIAGVISNLLD